MQEVITRRFKHPEWAKPDLILLDGGATQVAAVESVLSAIPEAKDIPVIGRNKSGNHSHSSPINLILSNTYLESIKKMAASHFRSEPPVKTGGRAGSTNRYCSIQVGSGSHLARLIARIDEESHRFAITYHHLLKRKNLLK